MDTLGFSGFDSMSIADIPMMSFIVPNAQRCQSKAFQAADNVRHLPLSNALV
jgi:hypothetical protein